MERKHRCSDPGSCLKQRHEHISGDHLATVWISNWLSAAEDAEPFSQRAATSVPPLHCVPPLHWEATPHIGPKHRLTQLRRVNHLPVPKAMLKTPAINQESSE